MKSVGIVRKLDQLNRIVIPKELVRTKELEDAAMEIFIEGENIILRKYQPSCIFCGSFKDVKEHMGKKVCKVCAKAIKN